MKTTLNLRIDKDLHDFYKRYAKENHTTITGVITQYAFYLKKRSRKHDNDLPISDLPDNQTKTHI